MLTQSLRAKRQHTRLRGRCRALKGQKGGLQKVGRTTQVRGQAGQKAVRARYESLFHFETGCFTGEKGHGREDVEGAIARGLAVRRLELKIETSEKQLHPATERQDPIQVVDRTHLGRWKSSHS